MLLWRTLALLAAGWAFCYCSTSKVVYPPEQLAPTEKALLWKISGNGLKQPSYLLGTIHLIPKTKFAVTGPMRDAMAQVERLVLEIDFKDVGITSLFRVMTKTYMSGGQTLRGLLPEEDYAFVREQIAQRSPLPMASVERMKPLFIGSLLMNEDGSLADNDKMTSVEMELYRLARKYKLGTAGLETIEYQLSLFDSIPYALQARVLVEQLRQQGNSDNELNRIVSLYLQKDLQAMEATTRESLFQDSVIQEMIIYRRNRDWIPIMLRMMREKPTLFAVGAGHLGGAKGVIALLRKEGFRVEAVE